MYMTEREFKDRDKIPEKDAVYMCSHESCSRKPTHFVKKDKYYFVNILMKQILTYTMENALMILLNRRLKKVKNGKN
ncbi:unnamed protein product [marine sediment metagenome]|uniref:Uncharacterized protein n=1 Tax=marine sediment metagenome TaxID=412755 RepID=X1NZW3_9ZZZZ